MAKIYIWRTNPVGFAFKRPYEGGHENQSHDLIHTAEHLKKFLIIGCKPIDKRTKV